MGRTIVIDTHRLARDFGSVKAVDSLTLSVEDGDVFGFLGPNGAGKTTTIRMLAGILPPTDGTAKVLGQSVTESISWKAGIGVMTESPGFYPLMTGMEHLLYWAGFYDFPRAEARTRAAGLLSQVNLDEYPLTRVGAYSHGMRKRLALAQALINDPELLLLDEPTGGLDPSATNEFRGLIQRFREGGGTVFLSSHLLDEVQRVCNRVAIIHRGKLVTVGSIRDVTERFGAGTKRGIEIDAEKIPDQILDRLSSLPSVSQVERTEDGVLVHGEDFDDMTADATAELVKAGIRVTSVRRQEPSLERAYLALIDEAEA